MEEADWRGLAFKGKAQYFLKFRKTNLKTKEQIEASEN